MKYQRYTSLTIFPFSKRPALSRISHWMTSIKYRNFTNSNIVATTIKIITSYYEKNNFFEQFYLSSQIGAIRTASVSPAIVTHATQGILQIYCCKQKKRNFRLNISIASNRLQFERYGLRSSKGQFRLTRIICYAPIMLQWKNFSSCW